MGKNSGEKRSDAIPDSRPSISFDTINLTETSDNNYNQPDTHPGRSKTHVNIGQAPLANIICSLSNEDLGSPLLGLPDNGSPRRLRDTYRDQPRVESIQCRAPVDTNRGSPATGIYCPSPETASSNDTGLSGDSDESSCFLEDMDSQLVLLHSKHMLLVDLMQEVYSIFDQRWAAKTQAHAGSSPSDTPYSSQNSTSDSSRKGKKRCRDDRDSTPPNDDESRKRPSIEISPNAEKQNDPFACPLHKHEPAKYCCSVVDGSKYRACIGPGFATIARLK